MDGITELAWRVYRDAFTDGDTVTVEDDKGRHVWGKLSTRNDGITLTRTGGWSRDLAWKEIVFICDDGFPFAKINGMTDAEADFRAKQTSDRIIRDKLIGLIQSEPHVIKKRSSKRVGGGCPFVYGPFEVLDVLNPGNNGPAFWGEDDEELLLLRARDGAIAHSFDISHLFLFDGLTL